MIQATTAQAYRLLHEGVKALSIVESNGARIDVPYLKKTIKNTRKEIAGIEQEIKGHKIGKAWRREFGEKTNYGSAEQLTHVLFNVFGFTPTEHKWVRSKNTKKKRYKADAASLETIDDPFVKSYLKCEKLKHATGTFLQGILSEVVGEFVHVNFNLHTAVTYRSSSSQFNYQNLPIRDPVLGAMIRQAFIPRRGRRIIESDYGGIEVKIAACYHKDPVMMEYLNDKSKDMHRDMAAQCYKIKPDQVSKMARYCAKNMFVFPQFYGSYFAQCAPNLWDAITTHSLEVDGKSLKEILARKGIVELGATESNYETGRIETPKGTFLDHIRNVENDFWKNRFKVYAKWKRDWFADYQRKGYFETKTGFRIEGVFARNDVINYPVQGPAFHCLLRSLIEIQRRIKKNRMDTLIIGQIHDSIISDVPDDEVQDYLGIVKEVMVDWLPKQWEWIIVPLEVEAEMTEIDGSWYGKKEVKIDE